MMTTTKEIKSALESLRNDWQKTSQFLNRMGNPPSFASDAASDAISEISCAQHRTMDYCIYELYDLIESINTKIINVEEVVEVVEEK